MQRLTDVWAGVERSVIDNAIDQRRSLAGVSIPAVFEPKEDIMNIHCDTN